MAYPKPLSQKTLDRMYKESGLTEAKIAFLRNLFDSAAALYGVITLNNLWGVYKEYSHYNTVVSIHKKDIITFSSIARREPHDYYIYEIDELYALEKRREQERYIILREVIDLMSIHAFYRIEELTQSKLYNVPENLLDLKGHVVSEEEEKLVHYIENLKADSSVLKYSYNKTIPSPHQGKKLKDFSYTTHMEQFEIDWLSGKREDGHKTYKEKQLKEFLRIHSGTTAEKIFREFRIRIFTGWDDVSYSISKLMKDLEEVGVLLSEKEIKELDVLITDFINNSHLYATCGMTPRELSKVSMRES
ncbi:MAG: hypothetical protein MSS69_11890 [Spirochaetales bacterium]|nr:hypothetical protein [Spirochaetales bacterium]